MHPVTTVAEANLLFGTRSCFTEVSVSLLCAGHSETNYAQVAVFAAGC
jgi:hypothetical protein